MLADYNLIQQCKKPIIPIIFENGNENDINLSLLQNCSWLLEFITSCQYQTDSEQIFIKRNEDKSCIMKIIDKYEKLCFMEETIRLQTEKSLDEYYIKPQSIHIDWLTPTNEYTYTADQLKKIIINTKGLHGLKSFFTSDQNEMSLIMCEKREEMRRWPSYSNKSMFVNNGEYLCTKIPIDKNSTSSQIYKPARTFWPMIWENGILTLVSFTKPTVFFYFPSKLSKNFLDEYLISVTDLCSLDSDLKRSNLMFNRIKKINS